MKECKQVQSCLDTNTRVHGSAEPAGENKGMHYKISLET